MRSNISNIHIKGKHLLLLVFVTATLLRGLPELLSGPYPVGYDLLAGYAPSVQALPETYPLRLFGWLWSSFSIFVLWFFWKISQLDLFTFLKIAAPVFYGLFSASFYYLLSKGVGWNNKKSFFTTLLFFLQPGILRLGWDQLRLMLGLVFLFLLLGLTKCDFVRGAQKRPAIFVSLSLLIIISQQLTATLFFVVVGWQLVRSFRERIPVLRALLLLSPSALIFSLQLYLDYFSTQVFSSHFIPLKLPSGSPLFAFTNYFLSDPRFINGNVLTVLAYVGNLSLYVVIPLIPLAVKGFFKEKVFLPILAWLLAASYSIAVFPWFAFSNYWWWIFLLPIPLTIYAGNALDKSGFTMKGKLSLRLIGGFFLLVIVAFGYASSTINIGYPVAYSYMPPGLVKSSVDFEYIPEIRGAIIWANQHLPENAVLIVPENFMGLAAIYSRSDINIRVAPPLLDLNDVVEKFTNMGNYVVGIYLAKDVEEIANKIESMNRIGSIGIFRIYA